MIIARIDPNIAHDLTFEMTVSGTNQQPDDIRFIIEGFEEDGVKVQDAFSIICRAIRGEDYLKIRVPRLLNLFRGGTYRARIEVVLEGKLFTPLSEEIEIIEPVEVIVKEHKQLNNNVSTLSSTIPKVSCSLKSSEHNAFEKVLETIKIEEQKPPPPVKKFNPEKRNEGDDSWKTSGFTNIKNPFKGI